MQNSKWQLSRVGLLDFWYYDEEEFAFLDGRMLLRGANGSGKSVTMQSFVPLLLDGNMRPERLDPFGSRARKMENYLLEEGDEREERTGYLWMECRREEGSNFLTLGIGLRARKNKKLDTWYFFINDGRRIGHDFFLYKDVENRIAYTKLELRNRIGEGGRVMESQAEYMEYVNRLLFGFETMEQYKELLDLLIQLRTPKLSKDFKPTVINDILSSSLQTLSEDDLRPMSEAIENMDALKISLDTLQEGVQAAKQIKRVYDSYNQLVLYQKADLLTTAAKELKDCDRAAKELDARIEAMQQDHRHEQERAVALEQEQTVLKAEQDSLAASDAAKLKEQELALAAAINDDEQQLRKKQASEAEKQEAYRQLARADKEQEAEADRRLRAMQDNLTEMEALVAELSFEEFYFLQQEVLAAPREDYSFQGHKQMLTAYGQKIDAGLALLQQEALERSQYDRQAQLVDDLRRERDDAQRESSRYRELLQEIRGELTERLYQWSRGNQELCLPGEVLQQLSRMVEAFAEGSDYYDLLTVVRAESSRLADELHKALRQADGRLEEAKARLSDKQRELADWQTRQEAQPEQSEAVRRSRQLLAEKGIPYQQFYKSVDFSEALSKEEAARLEEALEAMGLLDALIIPAQYREQVLQLDQGVCDRYIFDDAPGVDNSLLGLLKADDPDGDLFALQNAEQILRAIGASLGQAGSTGINGDGSYRLGILEGTITKEKEARYIGVRARRAHWQSVLEALQNECGQLQEEVDAAESSVQRWQQRLATVQMELAGFPSGDDLKLAAADYGKAQASQAHIEQRLAHELGKLGELEKQLLSVRLQVQEACTKAELSPRLDIFQQAKADLADYREQLTQLEISRAAYANGLKSRESLAQQMEAVDNDLDDIRYELGRLQQLQSEKRRQLQSVQEQLALTDYEQIKERLDYCLIRLQQLPKEIIACAQAQTALEGQLAAAREGRAQNAQRRGVLAQRLDFLREAFRQEYQLNFVERRFVLTDDMEDQAKKVCQMFAGALGSKKLDELSGDVQNAYHMNRGLLTDYNLTIGYLFEDAPADMPSMRRLHLTAKYRGIKVEFYELLAKLEQDMQELANLLSDKDRELFEDILANTISKKIRAKIYDSNLWVSKMNQLMESMVTSSGLRLSLKWKSKRAEQEEQLDTRDLVALLQKDVEIMREEEVESLSRHFRSKIEAARKLSGDTGGAQSFHNIMREVLDYRQWFEFQLEYQKTGEAKKELTDRAFFTFSGGEKAMSMYVPLFSAVVAKYAGARKDAPRIISLDEAFAGVDETNIKDMFRLMVNFEFNFMINSQILWGDYETVPALAIYQLIRPENAKYVTVITYIWNGQVRSLAVPAGVGHE